MDNNKDVLEELVRKAAEGAMPKQAETAEPVEEIKEEIKDEAKIETKAEKPAAIDEIKEIIKETESVKPAAPAEQPQPSPEDAAKAKMAKIRESLAKINHEDADEKPAQKPEAPQNAAVPPLQKHNEAKQAKKEAERRAAAETVVVDAKANAAAARQAAPAQKTGDAPKKAPAKKAPAAAGAAQPKKKKPAQASADPKRKGKKKALKKKRTSYGDTGITGGLLASVIGGGVLIAAIASYVIVAGTYQGKFLPNTLINGVEVAGLTNDEAEDALLDKAASRDVYLTTPKGETVEFKAEDFDAQYIIPDGAFTEASQENPYSWGGKLFGSTEYKIDYQFTYNEDKLRNLITSYDWGSEKSTDAYIRRTESGDFEIVAETLGDEFDTDKLMQYVDENIHLGMTKLKMEDSGCYEPYRANIKMSDLTDELALYNSFGKMTITFDFDDRVKTVTSDMIVSWLQLGDNGQVVKDEQGRVKFKWDDIAAFVEQMAIETDTFGTDRSFHATVDGWITVPWVDQKSWDKNNCSNYGWKINRDETTQQIIDLIRAGETVKTEPIYYSWGKGYVRATDDIGSTYIEADISEQHFWVYFNGVVTMEGDFVSGMESNWERRTPRGICQILDMQAGKYLGTMEVQGYRTWVDWWMAFNNCGCGFHDLSRGAYGGSIYVYNGSHGCLNLSWSKAKELYNTVFIGMPVIVHD